MGKDRHSSTSGSNDLTCINEVQLMVLELKGFSGAGYKYISKINELR